MGEYMGAGYSFEESLADTMEWQKEHYSLYSHLSSSPNHEDDKKQPIQKIDLKNALYGDKFLTRCGIVVIYWGLSNIVQRLPSMAHPYTFIHGSGVAYYYEDGTYCAKDKKWDLVEKIK